LQASNRIDPVSPKAGFSAISPLISDVDLPSKALRVSQDRNCWALPLSATDLCRQPEG
jgi:hypothetical protein